MADENAKPAKGGAQTRPTQSGSEPDGPRRLSHDDLVAGARGLLGVSPHAVRGALATEDRKTLTVEDAGKVVNKFLGREVDTDLVEPEAEAA